MYCSVGSRVLFFCFLKLCHLCLLPISFVWTWKFIIFNRFFSPNEVIWELTLHAEIFREDRKTSVLYFNIFIILITLFLFILADTLSHVGYSQVNLSIYLFLPGNWLIALCKLADLHCLTVSITVTASTDYHRNRGYGCKHVCSD